MKINIPARGSPMRELERAEQLLRAKSREVCAGAYEFSSVRSEAHFAGEADMSLKYEASVRCVSR